MKNTEQISPTNNERLIKKLSDQSRQGNAIITESNKTLVGLNRRFTTWSHMQLYAPL